MHPGASVAAENHGKPTRRGGAFYLRGWSKRVLVIVLSVVAVGSMVPVTSSLSCT